MAERIEMPFGLWIRV